jgi:site-specific DNA-cytosine methylase
MFTRAETCLRINHIFTFFMIPHRRRRIYIIAGRSFTSDDCNRLSSMMDRMQSHATGFTFPISEYLCDDTGPIVSGVLTELLDHKQGSKSSQSRVMKWPDQHAKAFTARGSDWQCTKWSPELSERFPFYQVLSPREKDILDYNDIAFPHKEEMVLDLSQSIGHTPIGHGEVPCVTPHARDWLAHRGRLLVALEKLRLQGIMLDADSTSSYSESLLADLAGNAMNGPVVLAVTIAALVVLFNHEQPLDAVHMQDAQSLTPPDEDVHDANMLVLEGMISGHDP